MNLRQSQRKLKISLKQIRIIICEQNKDTINSFFDEDNLWVLYFLVLLQHWFLPGMLRAFFLNIVLAKKNYFHLLILVSREKYEKN